MASLAHVQPANVRAIYDNGGTTVDRYTVVLDAESVRVNVLTGERRAFRAMLGLSEAPEHPQGVSQFTEGCEGPHLGRLVGWSALPEGLRRHIRARVT